jgi:hypothetical protein
MEIELFKKSFGMEQIKQREGNFGKRLDYVEARRGENMSRMNICW